MVAKKNNKKRFYQIRSMKERGIHIYIIYIWMIL